MSNTNIESEFEELVKTAFPPNMAKFSTTSHGPNNEIRVVETHVTTDVNYDLHALLSVTNGKVLINNGEVLLPNSQALRIEGNVVLQDEGFECQVYVCGSNETKSDD